MSLIEVLVASTVMTVALVSLAQVLALATSLNATAGRTTFASVLASEKEEELRALNWESLQRSVGESVDYLDRSGATTTVRDGAAYVRESTVVPLPQDPSNLVGITVVVRSAQESVSFASVRTRRLP